MKFTLMSMNFCCADMRSLILGSKCKLHTTMRISTTDYETIRHPAAICGNTKPWYYITTQYGTTLRYCPGCGAKVEHEEE